MIIGRRDELFLFTFTLTSFFYSSFLHPSLINSPFVYPAVNTFLYPTFLYTAFDSPFLR